MKLPSLVPLLLILGGCGVIAPDRNPPDPTPASGAPAGDAETVDAGQAQSAEEPDYYLPVADWLVQREAVCQQPNPAIDAQLDRYREGLSELPSGEEARVVHAYTQLKALMLASCNPARTPGLLKTFLSSTSRYSDWPPEYSALFDLLESEYRAYSLLEEKYRELETRHQRTIDGIGNIERNLESQTETPR